MSIRDEAWTPVQMFSVSTRLQSPLPPQDPTSKRTDFTNVADQACQMTALKLNGSSDKLGTSNVVPNDLSFDFLAFKSLSKLVLCNVRCSPSSAGGGAGAIAALGMVRRTLNHLQANNCGLKTVADILLCDVPHNVDDGEAFEKTIHSAATEWSNLEHLDLRYNDIEKLDISLTLAPVVKSLHLGGNKVSEIENLSELPQLSVLELADNEVSDISELNVKLGQVARIDLSHNKVKTLSGFSKLYSLRHLNVSANRIKDLDSVYHVSGLPCLESLNLQGNKATTVVDYRLKVFESFGKRYNLASHNFLYVTNLIFLSLPPPPQVLRAVSGQ